MNPGFRRVPVGACAAAAAFVLLAGEPRGLPRASGLAVPTPPSNVAAAWDAGPGGGGRITWSDDSADEIGFQVLRGVGAQPIPDVIASLPAGTEAYTDQGASAPDGYNYWVVAQGDTGDSTPTGPAFLATPATLDFGDAIPVYKNRTFKWAGIPDPNAEARVSSVTPWTEGVTVISSATVFHFLPAEEWRVGAKKAKAKVATELGKASASASVATGELRIKIKSPEPTTYTILRVGLEGGVIIPE